jgi:hypothetical protein
MRTKVACALAALAGASLLVAPGAPSIPQQTVQVLVASTGRHAALEAVRDAGGRPQTALRGLVQAVVPRPALAELRDDPAVRSVSPAPVASADAVTAPGAARIGADEYRSTTGATGAGVRVVILDTAFGELSRLDSLAGTALPVVPAAHRKSFDATYGLEGRDFNGDYSAHGEEVAEVAYAVAPGAQYWYVNYRTSLEFGQAVDYVVDQIHPDVVIHSNSFLFGPFDGTGWFARQVDRAAAAGILWVNSAGNYRLKHWSGAWRDANGDGSLDIPGHGDAIPFAFAAPARPACDLSWKNPDPAGSSGYALALYTDAAGTQPALDARTHQPIASTFVATPDPHASFGPAYVGAGTYYLRVKRVGTPDGTRLTLFCRQELPAGVDVTASSGPTPGDAVGALSVGAFDIATLAVPDYSTQGPTLDGRTKPDLAAPTGVPVEGGYFNGTSAAAPEVGGAAALLWPSLAAGEAPGSVAQRVRARLRQLALDMPPAGPDDRTGAGRVRLDTTPPVFGAPAPAPGAGVGGTVALRVPVEEAGTLDAVSATLDGAPLALTLGTGGVLAGSFDSHALPDGVHHVGVSASDKSGNVGVLDLPLRIDNTPPALGPTRPAANTPVSGVVSLRASLVDAGAIAGASVALGGITVPAALEGHTLTASLDTRALSDGVQHVGIAATDDAGNRALLDLPLLVDNTPPTLALAAPAGALAGAAVHVAATAAGDLSGLAAAPRLSFGDGTVVAAAVATHRYRRSGAFRIRAVVHDRAGNAATDVRTIRVAELRLAPSGHGVAVELARRERVRFTVALGRGRARRFTVRLSAGRHVVALGSLPRGAHAVVATARGFRTTTVVRVP